MTKFSYREFFLEMIRNVFALLKSLAWDIIHPKGVAWGLPYVRKLESTIVCCVAIAMLGLVGTSTLILVSNFSTSGLSWSDTANFVIVFINLLNFVNLIGYASNLQNYRLYRPVTFALYAGHAITLKFDDDRGNTFADFFTIKAWLDENVAREDWSANDENRWLINSEQNISEQIYFGSFNTIDFLFKRRIDATMFMLMFGGKKFVE